MASGGVTGDDNVRIDDVASPPIPESDARLRCAVAHHECTHRICGRWFGRWFDTPTKCTVWTILFLVSAIVISSVVGSSYVYVPYTHYGIPYNRQTQEQRNERILEGGAYPLGPGWTALLVPRIVQIIDLEERTGTALSVRALDGQRVSVDLSLSFIIPQDKVVFSYETYKGNPKPRIQETLSSGLLDIASRFETDEFFSSRIAIVDDMTSFAKEVAAEHGTELIDFQVRKLSIPVEFDERLRQVELNKIVSARRAKELVLNSTTATTERMIEASRVGRANVAARERQSIEHERLRIEAKIDAEEELEEQERAAIQADLDRELAVIRQELANSLEGILGGEESTNKTTERLVASVYSSGNRTLELLAAERDKNVSAVLSNVTLVQKQTEAAVAETRALAARIRADADALAIRTLSEAEGAAKESTDLAAVRERLLISGIDRKNLQTLASAGFNGTDLANLAFIRSLDNVSDISAADFNSNF